MCKSEVIKPASDPSYLLQAPSGCKCLVIALRKASNIVCKFKLITINNVTTCSDKSVNEAYKEANECVRNGQQSRLLLFDMAQERISTTEFDDLVTFNIVIVGKKADLFILIPYCKII